MDPHGHPQWSHHYSRYCRRTGGRFLWFAIGAGTTAWVMSCKEHHAEWHRARHCWRDRIPQEAYPAPGEERDKYQRGWGWGWHAHAHPPPPPPPQVAEKESALPAERAGAKAAAPQETVHNPMTDRWEEERVRMQAFGKQATDTMADISEATLETLLTTIESLKEKLAEHRAQREKQEEQLNALHQERLDRFRQFEEWQRSQEQSSTSKGKKDDTPRRMV